LLQPTRYELDLRVDFKEERISGSARITLKNTGGSPAREASFLLYRHVGQESFNAIVGGYYLKYQTSGATTAQLVSHANTVAGRELTPFFNDWLYSSRWYGILASGSKVQDLADLYRRPVAQTPLPAR
jgi:aminopeptidase N